ncbi:DEAD/DEAH box helicase [Falsiroseomonas sp. HC035]|uniref:DEAD/DEAH box helicase n=1 Tax=Falsiroseomonas sp. HC035 TaxID=3390999 RepID=UPI003D31F33B
MLPAEPDALLAARLVEAAMEAGPGGLAFIARGEARAARLHRAALALAPDAMEVLLLPGWDVPPYDRAGPSRAVVGQRMATAAALARDAAGPRLLLLPAEAAMQRLGRPAAELVLRAGAGLDAAALEARLEALGYRLDERVDEPGEAAIHGGTLDLFPAWAAEEAAWRIRHEEARILEIRRYDPLTQRSLEETVDVLRLGPATEDWADSIAPLSLLPQARIVLDDGAEAALRQRRIDVTEGFAARIARVEATPPDRIYLDEAAWTVALEGRVVQPVGQAAAEAGVPRFAGQSRPEQAFLAWAEALLRGGRRLALAGGAGRGARRLLARLADRLDRQPVEARDWPALLAALPGSLAWLPAAPDAQGFATPEAVLVPMAAIHPAPDHAAAQAGVLDTQDDLRPGDAVIHLDHGLAELCGVETVAAGEARQDCLRLRFAGDSFRLVPFEDLPRIWRYGAEAASVKLDGLDGASWSKRQAAAEVALRTSAEALLEQVRARETASAPILRPPEEAYAEVAARFRHEPTPGQAAAIAATLTDLASGRPMDRLVCGDVGFGKTEVAIRAAAAAALAGRQVALLAPTTVLVRQHLETFRQRFAGLPLRIAALSRLSPPAEARATRAAIARGEIAIAIGTQALAAKSVTFQDLGLLIIDEEQRFGARQKAALAGLRAGEGLHVLTLTATPIPRTLQSALVGLRDLSVIATPPARRQPVRTLRATLDDGLLARALRREAARGGQSFLVCPRIEDIAPMRARLERLVPDLTLVEAHGGLAPAEMDAAMVGFAEGGGDVLLSTNIVEAGLDIPRANTMLVWRADRFGLSQLHQLRGRVGRGRVRGSATLVTEPGQRLSAATERRLRTLEALDRFGAGFAISARDLDLRGAGDLAGEDQAGHMRLVGLELYRHLLRRALATARGETPEGEWAPVLVLGIDAFVPEDHVRDASLRTGLLGRLAQLLRHGDAEAVARLEDELEDRFGPAPPPLRNLLALAGLAVRCRAAGIARLDVGPEAAAATLHAAPPKRASPPLRLSNGRLVLPRSSEGSEARLAVAAALVEAVEGGG